MIVGNPNLMQLMLTIREGRLVLPDIQRNFVWEKDQIYLFCDSLLRGYPYGSFLFWRVQGNGNPDNTIVYRSFLNHYHEGVRLSPGVDLAEGEEKLLVLDGQQRLQSLYLCLFGNYEGKDLYLDLLSGKQDYDKEHDLKYYVRFFDDPELRTFYGLPAGRGRKMVRVKDFVELDAKQCDARAARAAVEQDIPAEDRSEAERLVRSVWQTMRDPTRVQQYTIDASVSSVADVTSLTEVAEIFVRVNSGGTRLTRSELVFTLLKSRWKNASDEIATLCSELNSRGEFEVDSDFIIRSLLVLGGYSSRVNVERLRDDKIMAHFKQIFPRAREALRSTFDFLTQPNGGSIRTYRLLTSGQRADRGYNVVLPIAHYLFLRPTQEIPTGELRRLRRYLYTAIFSRYVVVYVESHIDYLAAVIRKASEAGERGFPIDAVVKEIKAYHGFDEISDFFDDRAVLDPLLNILSGGPTDFRTLSQRNAPERDHIFPRAQLEARGVSDEKINHYANMRLLGKIENILKSDDDPVTALASYSDEVLERDYLIPKSLLDYGKYDEFLRARAALVRRRVDSFLQD